MIADVEHTQIRNVPRADRVYPSNFLPRLQSLLAALADIDLAYERRLEIIRSSPADDERKNELIADLRQSHCEQRTPYVQELQILRERMEVMFGWDGRDRENCP